MPKRVTCSNKALFTKQVAILCSLVYQPIKKRVNWEGGRSLYVDNGKDAI